MRFGTVVCLLIISLAFIGCAGQQKVSKREFLCDARIGPFVVSDESKIADSTLKLVLTNMTGKEITNMNFNLSGGLNGTLEKQTMIAGGTKGFSIKGTSSANDTITITVSYNTQGAKGNIASGACRWHTYTT